MTDEERNDKLNIFMQHIVDNHPKRLRCCTAQYGRTDWCFIDVKKERISLVWKRLGRSVHRTMLNIFFNANIDLWAYLIVYDDMIYSEEQIAFIQAAAKYMIDGRLE